MATSQELVADASCYAQCIQGGMGDAVIISLLAQIAGVEDMTPQELVSQASCYLSCLQGGMGQAVMISLLSQIVTGGGTGGSSGITCSPSSDPSGVPTGNCGIWVRLDVGQLWIYNAGDGTWDSYLS